jgi:hypothetical protein
MAATRLNDSQKQALVARYCAGESSQALAEAFGCSPNTVSRVVKAALDPAAYAALKQQRSRGTVAREAPLSAPRSQSPPGPADPDLAAGAEHGVLAIDDADDFDAGAEDDETDLDLDAEESETFVVLPVALADHGQEPVRCQPLAAADLPASLYMLVDKTVELQARPLREIGDLGLLPAEEEERQALQLFANPRQAKRLCGRSQRVIKMPDPRVLERTAPYLLAQGISRLVVEGALYSLPGS